jgi:hypothetical protein
MRKRIALSEITEWIYSLSDARFEEVACAKKSDHPRLTEDEFDLEYWLSECNDKFFEWLVSQGLYLRNDQITYDPDNFDAIAKECNAVMADYDSDVEEIAKLGLGYSTNPADYDGQRHANTPWVRWELRGDDDVDYHGGYILIVLDVLIEYEKDHLK